jgi:hypothetical protein
VTTVNEFLLTTLDGEENGLVVERDHSEQWGDAYAIFDATRTYRYSLGRCWGPGAWRAYVMLNPSTADAFKVDPTVGRCLKRAKADGMGGALVLNLFAFRSRHPADLLTAEDPIGPLNNDFLLGMPERVWPHVIVGWGCGPSSKRGRDLVGNRARIVAAILDDGGWMPHSLQVNDDGSPKHPLYCRDADVPTPWAPPYVD